MGNRSYSPELKTQVIEEVEVGGNIVQICKKYGLARQTIYNWQEDKKEAELQAQIAEDIAHPEMDKDEEMKEIERLKKALSQKDEEIKRLKKKVAILLINLQMVGS